MNNKRGDIVPLFYYFSIFKFITFFAIGFITFILALNHQLHAAIHISTISKKYVSLSAAYGLNLPNTCLVITLDAIGSQHITARNPLMSLPVPHDLTVDIMISFFKVDSFSSADIFE